MAERHFPVASHDEPDALIFPKTTCSLAENSKSICTGWILKKRRKMLQGYARRYFALDCNGFLSYSFQPGTVIRDQIFLPTAAISSSPSRRDIHVDSERVTFHLKCLSEDDSRMWMDALRKFTVGAVSGKPMRRPTMPKAPCRRQSVGIQQTAEILGRIGKTIDELASACNITDEEDPNYAPNADIRKQASSLNRHGDKESHSLLSLFKKTPSSSSGSIMPRPSFTKDTLSSNHSLKHFLSLVERLRKDYNLLSSSLNLLSDNNGPKVSAMEHSHQDESISGSAMKHQAPLHSLAMSHRQSISSAASSASIWYDAVDEELGAEEYLVQNKAMEDEIASSRDERATDASSSVHRESDGDDDTHSDDESRTYALTKQQQLEMPIISIPRRARLPATQNGEEGSLFAILKKNVGQDLSNIAFPVTFNEPLTLLQRLTEEVEYYELLNKAAATVDWEERFCYIAAFAVSGYACTKYRSGRKGFTPLLGETFEDARMNFIAEKVVHKPLIIAFHADGPGWELSGTSSGKTKFWGKSFEIIPTGITEVRIGNDVYQWNKPSSFTRNLMMGTKYLEHCGEMVISNVTTGARCIVDFKGAGYWAATTNVVAGTVYTPDGDAVTEIEGKWDEHVSRKLEANYFKVLWRSNSFPRDTTDYYGFTYFGMTLNEITSDIKDKLPCTDSRFRPDVRALEEGDIALAESEKERLEQMQRDRRQLGQDPKPRWFRRVNNSDEWVYAGGYWEARNEVWKACDIEPLW